MSRRRKEHAVDTAIYVTIAVLQGLQAVERLDWKTISGVLAVGLIALKAKRSKGIEDHDEESDTRP